MIAVTTKTFETEVLAAEQPVIVDFWAPWCGPCRAVVPVLERIAAERVGKVRVAKVNVDAEPALALRYRITSIPAIILFEGGKQVVRVTGARSKSQLEKALGLADEAAGGAGAHGRFDGLLGRFRGRR